MTTGAQQNTLHETRFEIEHSSQYIPTLISVQQASQKLNNLNILFSYAEGRVHTKVKATLQTNIL